MIRTHSTRTVSCPTKVRTFGDLDDADSDIVKLLKTRKFFFQKEEIGTLPKLFYLLPEDAAYAKQSVAHGTRIHTWEDIQSLYTEANKQRSKEWRR